MTPQTPHRPAWLDQWDGNSSIGAFQQQQLREWALHTETRLHRTQSALEASTALIYELRAALANSTQMLDNFVGGGR